MASDHSLEKLAKSALEGNPDEAAVVFRGLSYDWGWMRDIGDRVVELLEMNGAPRHLPVGLVARNRPSSIATLLALIAQGWSVRMIYPFQSPTLLAKEVAEAGIAALIASDEDLPSSVVDAMTRQNLCTISIDDETGVGPLADGGMSVQDAGRGEKLEPRIEMLTSGTTGTPKLFPFRFSVLFHRMLSQNVKYTARERIDRHLGATIVFYPLGTISGLYSILPPIMNRALVILQDKFDLDGWLDYVVTYRPDRATLPPSGLVDLLQRNVPHDMLSSLQSIGTGAAPIGMQAQTAFEERYGIPVLISFGATEFGGPVAAMTSELHGEWGNRKRGSCGRAWGGARLRIVDPATGKELPPGEDGLLEVVSPLLGNDWIRTSDLAMIDEAGFLYHRGRADGAITRGGFSLLPEVIERVLLDHPKVAAAAVVGLPHRYLGEVPAAAIQPVSESDPPDVSELESFMRNRIYATHIPKHFRIVSRLPRTSAMKVDLAKVRGFFAKADGDAGKDTKRGAVV